MYGDIRVENSTWCCCTDCRCALVGDFSVRGKEWRCPNCGEFTEFFDRHSHLTVAEIQAKWPDWVPPTRA
jgi:hypothetical protein